MDVPPSAEIDDLGVCHLWWFLWGEPRLLPDVLPKGSTLGSGLGASYLFGGACFLPSCSADFAIIGDLGSLALGGSNTLEGLVAGLSGAFLVSSSCRFSRNLRSSCPR
jgi:hypothetical protein